MTINKTQAIRKAIAAMFPERYSRQNWRSLLFEFVNDSLKPIIIHWFESWQASIDDREEKPSLAFPLELTPAAELLAKQEGLSYAQLAIYYYIQLNQVGALGADYIRLTKLHKTSHSQSSFEHLERPVDLSGDVLSRSLLEHFTGSESLNETNIEALAKLAHAEYNQYDEVLVDHIRVKRSQLGDKYVPEEDVEFPFPPQRLYSAIALLSAFRGASYQDLAWDLYMVQSEQEAADEALENNACLIQQLKASTRLIRGISDPNSRLN